MIISIISIFDKQVLEDFWVLFNVSIVPSVFSKTLFMFGFKSTISLLRSLTDDVVRFDYSVIGLNIVLVCSYDDDSNLLLSFIFFNVFCSAWYAFKDSSACF